MRAAVLTILVACSGPMRPAVIPKLSELPVANERRDKVLDSSHVEPGPEQQPKTPKERKVETYAATAAAVLGWLMSDTENVTLGGSTTIDETGLVPTETASQKKAREEREAEAQENAKPKTEPVTHDEPLLPWINLKQ